MNRGYYTQSVKIWVRVLLSVWYHIDRKVKMHQFFFKSFLFLLNSQTKCLVVMRKSAFAKLCVIYDHWVRGFIDQVRKVYLHHTNVYIDCELSCVKRIL